MKLVFVASEGFPRTLTRKKALGHKTFEIAADVNPMDAVELVTVGDKLVCQMDANASEDDEEERYLILTKSFGLLGINDKLSSKMSIILLDDDWALVTLHTGGIVVTLDGNNMMPTVGEFECRGTTENIMWLDSHFLLEYGKYLRNKGNFMYDFEFVLSLSGGIYGDGGSMKVVFIREEDVDLSQGYFAQWEQRQKMREQARAAKSLFSMIEDKHRQALSYEDDDDEDYDDTEETELQDEDDDGSDWSDWT